MAFVNPQMAKDRKIMASTIKISGSSWTWTTGPLIKRVAMTAQFPAALYII